MKARFNTSFKSFSLILKLTLFLSGAFSWASLPVSQIDSQIFQDENQYIMQVALDDGTIVSDGLDLYQSDFRWYIPLGVYVDALGFSITTSAQLGAAEGFYISEQRRFKLNVANCSVEYSEIQEKYECPRVQVFDDEIYVESTLLERWFMMSMAFNTHASKVIVQPKLKLPIQSRLERDRNNSSGTTRRQKSTDAESEVKFEKLEDQKIGDFQFDNQVGWFERRTGSEIDRELSYSSSWVSEVMGFKVKSSFSGSEGMLQNSYLNLSKKSSEGGIFGVQSLRSFEANDLQLNRVPLIADSLRGKGVTVSSYPLTQITNFTKKDFRGPLLPGWEVELYQNDLLIERFVSGGGAEYSFKDVILFYGLNRFKLIFYGPQGQIKEELETYNIGNNFVTPGESHYQFSVLEDDDGSQNQIATVEMGVADFLSTSLTYFSFFDKSEKTYRQYGLLGMNGRLGAAIASLNLVQNSESGRAVEAGLSTSWSFLNLSFLQAEYQSFRKAEIDSTVNLVSSSTANAVVNLGHFLPLTLSGSVIKKSLIDDSTETEVVQRSAWQIGKFYFFNTFSRVLERQKAWKGELSILGRQSYLTSKVSFEYQSELEAIAADLQYSISDNYFTQARVRRDFTNAYDDVSVNFVKMFESYRINVEALADTRERYYFGGGLAFSGFLDVKHKKLGLSPHELSELGIVKAVVYLDENQNMQFDENERPLNGVGFYVNNNEFEATTEDVGVAYLTRLPAYHKVSVRVDPRGLEDAYSMRPMTEGHVVLRPGVIHSLNFPIWQLTDLDGSITWQKGERVRGARGLKVQLWKKNGDKPFLEAVTESDGYFYFEGIPFGTYRLVIAAESRAGLSGSFESEVELDQSGLSKGSPDFRLKKLN